MAPIPMIVLVGILVIILVWFLTHDPNAEKAALPMFAVDIPSKMVVGEKYDVVFYYNNTDGIKIYIKDGNGILPDYVMMPKNQTNLVVEIMPHKAGYLKALLTVKDPRQSMEINTNILPGEKEELLGYATEWSWRDKIFIEYLPKMVVGQNYTITVGLNENTVWKNTKNIVNPRSNELPETEINKDIRIITMIQDEEYGTQLFPYEIIIEKGGDLKKSFTIIPQVLGEDRVKIMYGSLAGSGSRAMYVEYEVVDVRPDGIVINQTNLK